MNCNMNIHLAPKKIRFSLFTSEEIKKMCVTQIITPLTLDALGHPLPGGLYDRKLGPLSDKSDVCETCCKSMTNCPGHFGYIELPLPVINPLFHKIIGTILKMSCLQCHLIQIPTHVKRVLTIQMKLLNCGQIIAATEVETKMWELISTYSTYENIPQESMAPILHYEHLANQILDDLNGDLVTTQNVESLKNFVFNQTLKQITATEMCMYCKAEINKMQLLKNKIIMAMRKRGRKVGEVTGLESRYVNPEQSRQYMRKIYAKEKDFIEQFVSVLQDIKIEHPTDVFFFQVVPVPPSNVRPLNFVNGRVVENKQSVAYKRILQDVILLRAIIQVVQQKGDQNNLSSTQAKAAYSAARGNTAIEKLNYAWEDLQYDVNGLVDKDSTIAKGEGDGLKQIIEKKEGIIRMCMMGKRVNFSARSVITPDPNLNIDEIGIPEEFAKQLTYPVPVTPWNVDELRKMILNGPNVHPGAVMVEMNGQIKRINPKSQTQQKSLLKSLLTPEDKIKGSQSVKIVYRHLCNGDILLLNRQPTLHKPSIMAHTARILKGEKTLRLNYANCKAYNADFDGDEMNAHFPQNEVARSEGYNIANVSNQYLVPKDGTPLSGLIQDYMIAGVRLSLRGRFFNRDDYQQLVYQGLAFKTDAIKLLPPAIIKPKCLWSGKQILSTMIINIIPQGRPLINLTSTSKIPGKAWQLSTPRMWKAGGTLFTEQNTMSEAEVIIRNGELLVGILDKQHYGATPYSLAHCIYELYGGSYAIKLLSAFSKLFMSFLQQEGFTLGVQDILLVHKADKKRKRKINVARQVGREAVTSALDIPEDTPAEEIVQKIEEVSAINPKIRSAIDRQYKVLLDGFTNGINKACLPTGLICKFPQNNLQLMVQSGAKGSTVNTMQISCLLGQIELEGKRPPVMISGKSLPSFPAFEFSPRAGGFIDGRFMTGIQPQEFFFHCMAGREGLIDTAVKTSRSGYLQRCLIKHLEGLKIEYDMTVRNSDKSVIQFHYGEDGMDILKSQFLNKKQMQFLSENIKVLRQPENLEILKSNEKQPLIDEYLKKIQEWKLQYGDPLQKTRKSPFSVFSQYVAGKNPDVDKSQLQQLWYDLNAENNTENANMKESFKEFCALCPDPVDSTFQPDANFGAINERIEKLLEDFQPFKRKKAKREFRDLIKLKVMQSMCAPGEPVGLLAAQSIGEPSTQMTLNTFHFAGRGEMNVTLGIPRLREILMTASKVIKTPSMEVPFLPCPDVKAKAAQLRKMLARVVIADVLENIDVSVKLETKPKRQHTYVVKFNFLPKKYYSHNYYVTPKQILAHMKKHFFAEMFTSIRKFCKVKGNLVLMDEKKTSKSSGQNNDNEDEEITNRQVAEEVSSSEDEVENEEDAKITRKIKDWKEDQEPEEEEIEASEAEESDEEPERKEGLDDSTVEDKSVVDSYNFAQNYMEDAKKHEWCQMSFALPLNFKKLDLSTLLKEVASKSVLWETPNIRRAIVYTKDDQTILKTEGVNIVEMFKYYTVLDVQKLYCNDIHKVAQTYGIEAATKVIVREVKDVFNVYGIKVDPRHLSLIADYMTSNGTFEPLSRKGMESSASPLQQISFESSLTFLKNATTKGKRDDLQNPSSCLMVGKPCGTGTGSFTLLHRTVPSTSS